MNTDILATEYYNHPYNDTKNCERMIELPLAFNYLSWIKSNSTATICELGAVTCYYEKPVHDVIDPLDPLSNIKVLSQDYDFRGKNVLSISTLEHFGAGDYVPEVDANLAFSELKRIVAECSSCFITWPIGYNRSFDSQVRRSLTSFQYFFYEKISDEPKIWQKSLEARCFDHGYGPRGNCIICICKNVT